MIYIYTLTTINLFPFSGELQALLNKQKILELLENKSRSIRKKAIKREIWEFKERKVASSI